MPKKQCGSTAMSILEVPNVEIQCHKIGQKSYILRYVVDIIKFSKWGEELKQKLVVFCLCLLLTAVFVTAYITPAGCVGAGEWITKYRVEDLKTSQLIIERDFQTGSSGNF